MLKDKINDEVLGEYKRVNNDTWICNQIEELVFQYEKYLKIDEERKLDEYEQGEHNELLAIVTELKEILYKKMPDFILTKRRLQNENKGCLRG